MHADIKKLLDHSVEYSTELLVETGESYPFGAYIDRAGNVHPLEMEIDSKNVPTIQRVIDALSLYCKEEFENQRMIAYCLSYEVKVKLDEQTETDAISFDITHSTEQEIPKFYLPFKSLRKTDQELVLSDDTGLPILAELGELFAVR